MNTYIARVVQDANMSFAYILILVFGFFATAAMKDIRQQFLVVSFTVVILVGYYTHSLNIVTTKQDAAADFAINETIQDTTLINDRVFDVHNKPKRFVYIHLNEDVIKTLNSLAFIKMYDEAAFDRLIIHMEYFLKVYYYILKDKYTCTEHVPILQDIRIDMLNTIGSFYLNVPQFSDSVDGNIYERIDSAKHSIQAITYKHLKIVNRKCRKQGGTINFNIGEPSPCDAKRMTYELY
jgi:hypothetical protein